MPIDQQLVESVLDSPQLPSLPAIALEIIQLVQEDDADVDKIAETISLDPALSSKLLKTVNSSFYGLPKTVGSVQQAVIVLGLNSVKTLALGFSLVNNLTTAGGDGFDHLAFWRRSLLSAAAAKQLCDRLNIVQAEEVFIASLLQDVGVLALSQVMEDAYIELVKTTRGDHRKLAAAERETLGGDHADVGAAMAESWSLPPLLVESVRFHERPEDAPENLVGLIRAVYAGGLAAGLIEFPDDQTRVQDFHAFMQQHFDIEQPDAEAIIKNVFKDASEMQRLFELPTGELGNCDDILARANRALEAVSLGCAQENHQLKQDNQKLKAEASRDAVTGLLNRRRFDERLDELFLMADGDTPLSVIFIDLDGFKQVNDTHGHPVGDSILLAIAQAVDKTASSSGDAFRYGGDEITLLCQGLGRAEAAVLAEKLRVQIEKTACEVSDEEPVSVSLTASIGVATYDGEAFKRPEQLVRAADRGVYAAKHGGRNAVRVFVPKAQGKPKAA
ncbi:MAG: HDOD domain-containing protein [Phycisphaeraceae bacterium]